jgi:uncharacterized protein YegP (UPF0339 family)
VAYWSYNFSQFLYKAKEILNIDITTKTLEEIQMVSEVLEDDLTSKDTFRYWKDDNEFYFFSFNLSNDLPILYSNAFFTKEACLKGIGMIKEEGAISVSYEKVTYGNDRYFFKIASHGQVLAQSIMFSTSFERNYCFDVCKTRSYVAQVTEIIK